MFHSFKIGNWEFIVTKSNEIFRHKKKKMEYPDKMIREDDKKVKTK